MNLNIDISEFTKDPYGFYFDLDFGDEKSCSIKIKDHNFLSELEMDVSLVENTPEADSDDEMTQREGIIIIDKYDSFCCIKNYTSIGRYFSHEFHFTFFVDRELNTYYVENDHENCSDEYPVDDTYCQELSIFPEILKILFVNPPSYIGYQL